MAAPLWALVLSDNHGRRPSGMLAGVARPMWSADGGPSLLEQALARVAGLVPGARTVTVIGPTQRATAAALRKSADPGFVLRQPGDRGTAPGVLLGLAAILDTRPDAHVVLTPANYGLRDIDQFRVSVREASACIRTGLADIIAFGARPTGSDTSASWITPGAPMRDGSPRLLRRADALVERPGAEDVAELLRHKAVWHTGVIVARAAAVHALFESSLPYMVEMLNRVLREKPARRAARLEEEYRILRPAEFTRDVLVHAADLAVYLWPATIGYALLSSPDRLEAWQRQSAASHPRRAALAPFPRRAFGT